MAAGNQASKHPDAIRKVAATQNRIFTGDVIASMDRWLLIVRVSISR